MPRRRNQEKLSPFDQANLFLAPILVVLSWYMYAVTRDDRYAFGPVIGEHVSNFFGSALAMYLATALTSLIEQHAEFLEIRRLAQFLQVVSAIALVGINLHFEVWEGNTQMVQDLLSAVLAISVVWASTRRSMSVLEGNSSKLQNDDLE